MDIGGNMGWDYDEFFLQVLMLKYFPVEIKFPSVQICSTTGRKIKDFPVNTCGNKYSLAFGYCNPFGVVNNMGFGILSTVPTGFHAVA